MRDFSTPVNVPNFAYVSLNQWSTIDYENGSIGNYNAGTGEYTIPNTGVYHIDVQIYWNAPAATGAGYSGVDIFVNGVQQVYGVNTLTNVSIVTGTRTVSDLTLNAGDKVRIRIFHNTSGTITVNNSPNANFWAIHQVK